MLRRMVNSIKVIVNPNPYYNVHCVRNSGLPKGREPYGNGVPIVLRSRESLLHGKVEQEIIVISIV